MATVRNLQVTSYKFNVDGIRILRGKFFTRRKCSITVASRK